MKNVLPVLRYLWELHRELPDKWREKKKILSQMEASIRDYVSEGERISYRQIRERFGEPKQVAQTYIMEMESDELISNLRISGKIVKIVAAAMFAVVIVWASFASMIYIEHLKSANGYATVEITVIERKVVNDGE